MHKGKESEDAHIKEGTANPDVPPNRVVTKQRHQQRRGERKRNTQLNRQKKGQR